MGMMEQNGFPFQLYVKALTSPPATVARTNYLFRSPSNLMDIENSGFKNKI
jgi:hypothetical protein